MKENIKISEKERTELENIAGIQRFAMPQPDPLEGILRKARKKVEKRLEKAFKEVNNDDTYKYFCAYRTLTKLINREPLSIFDL